MRLICRSSIAILILLIGCVAPFPDLENVSAVQEQASPPEQGDCSDQSSLGGECTYTCPATSTGYPSTYICVNGALECGPRECSPTASGPCQPGAVMMCSFSQDSISCNGRKTCSSEGQWEDCRPIQETCVDTMGTTDATQPAPIASETCNQEDDDRDGIIDEAPDNQKLSCATSASLPGCPSVDPVCQIQSDGTTQFICPPIGDHWCGSCRSIEQIGGRHIICNQPQSRDFAADRCIELGAELSQFERTLEPRALQNILGDSTDETYWVAGERERGIRINYTTGSAPKGLVDFLSTGEMDGAVRFNVSSGLLEFANPNERHGYLCELPCSEEDADQDGYTECQGDCAPNNRSRAPYAGENTNDGIDNNCNGLIDELNVEICDDNLDNDRDGQEGEGSTLAGEECINHSVQTLNCSLLWINQVPFFDCASEWTWDFANGLCDTHSARLANFNVHSWQQYWAYRLEVHNSSSSVWFGVRRRSGSSSFTYRPSGLLIAETDQEWLSFVPGEPQGSGENCLELQCDDTDCAGRWNNEQCWVRNHFVCEYIP